MGRNLTSTIVVLCCLFMRLLTYSKTTYDLWRVGLYQQDNYIVPEECSLLQNLTFRSRHIVTGTGSGFSHFDLGLQWKPADWWMVPEGSLRLQLELSAIQRHRPTKRRWITAIIACSQGISAGPILSVFFAPIVYSELKSVHPGFPVAFIFYAQVRPN